MIDFELEIKMETIEELLQNLDDFNDAYLRLEEEITEKNINDLFRHIHSFKGGSKLIGFDEISVVAHKLEDLIGLTRKDISKYTQDFSELLIEFHDYAQDIMESLKKDLNFSYKTDDFQKKVLEFSQKMNDNQEKDSNNKIKVLLIDDEPDILEIIEENISLHFNVNCTFASNGQEAITKCGTDQYDIIITDYKMPQMSGGEFLNLIRTNDYYKSTPVLLITAFMPDIDFKQPIWENVLFMEKPMNFKKINLYLRCFINNIKSAA